MSKMLSTAQDVLDVADHFFAIADALHMALKAKGPVTVEGSEYLYALLIEEYGLRTRAGILRNTARSYALAGVATDQHELMKVLTDAKEAIEKIEDLRVLRTLTATIATLCVSICPTKGRIIDFLVAELQDELAQIRVH